MASGEQHAVILVGGPDAGKSNFLFRFWIAVDHGGGALVKDGLPQDIEYLRAGAERLLEGEFADRTSKEVHEQIVVPIKSSASPLTSRGILVVPDMPGEQILAVYRNRQWSRAWEDLVGQRCACLVLIRAGSDEIVAPLDWAQCFERYGAVINAPEPDQAKEANADGVNSSDQVPTNAEKGKELPTQVVLTEWLQFLRRAFTSVAGGSFRPRIGIVISGWDEVPTDQKPNGPLAYLRDNFPMLHQYVQASDDLFDFQVFGVAIVNGDLKKDEEFRATYLQGRPQDFGLVVHSLSGEPSSSSDITLPVAWALGLLHHVS